MPSSIGISGSGNIGGYFTVGSATDSSSVLDGRDFIFGPDPRFGLLEFDESRTDDSAAAVFYGSPVVFGTAQIGEFHGYLQTSAMFFS
jgi:hypothetical protein